MEGQKLAAAIFEVIQGVHAVSTHAFVCVCVHGWATLTEGVSKKLATLRKVQ